MEFDLRGGPTTQRKDNAEENLLVFLDKPKQRQGGLEAVGGGARRRGVSFHAQPTLSPPPRSRRLLRAPLLLSLSGAQIRRRREVASRHGVASGQPPQTLALLVHAQAMDVSFWIVFSFPFGLPGTPACEGYSRRWIALFFLSVLFNFTFLV